MLDELKADLIRDEGVKLHPYRDTSDKLTIGVGRNLDDKGITNVEAFQLLGHDIDEVLTDLDAHLPWWRDLTDARQRGLANMRFQLGMAGLLGFQRMLMALKNGAYETAAAEALDSLWHGQTPDRAERIADLFKRG